MTIIDIINNDQNESIKDKEQIVNNFNQYFSAVEENMSHQTTVKVIKMLFIKPSTLGFQGSSVKEA